METEDIPSIADEKLRYDMFVKAYNETREQEEESMVLLHQGCF
jgi:hypothetical protein